MIKEEVLFTKEQKKEIIDLIVCAYKAIKRTERQQQECLQKLDKLDKNIGCFEYNVESHRFVVNSIKNRLSKYKAELAEDGLNKKRRQGLLESINDCENEISRYENALKEAEDDLKKAEQERDELLKENGDVL